jgi:protein-disulfide isomerase
VAGAPSRGPANAAVTIVEFEDFQCPYCKSVQPTLKQILSHYGDKVRLVYVDYPLESLHPAALQAHQAARCAGEQDKFWEYHDLLFKNSPAASPEQLENYAKQAGMDLPAFKTCLSSGKYQSAIQKNEEEGNKLGVNGTPAFFINGRSMNGAQSFEEFSRIIDEELAAKEKIF